MKVISLFSGCGGLDLGFEQASFDIVMANEFDKTIWDTYLFNHPNNFLVKGDVKNISNTFLKELKRKNGEIDGIIGGPPCQSWSVAGSQKGIEDSRGQLFLEYIRILKTVQPKFFLLENVKGMLSEKHFNSLSYFIGEFEKSGYEVKIELLSSDEFGIGQIRQRLVFVGFRKDLSIKYKFPVKTTAKKEEKICLYDLIGDLDGKAVKTKAKNKHNEKSKNNHEYFVDSFSPVYLSRNRRKNWTQPAFTVQASGRQCQLHPSSPKMIWNGKEFSFQKGKECLYRRMSVRECARIQGFPDGFKFVYQNTDDAYKMIGNAVPVRFAYLLAKSIQDAIERKE